MNYHTAAPCFNDNECLAISAGCAYIT